MTKTIKEWLSELPDGYRERALANTDKDMAKDMEASMSSALVTGFNWREKSEGFAFWASVHSFYCGSVDSLPPLP